MMTAAEIENALCSVKRPRGQLKTRGLHLYDLMKPSAPLPVSIKGFGGSVSQFPFVLGLAMRLHGDGAKTVGKKLGRPWEPFQNIVRDLGLKPLTNNESRNRPTFSPDDKAQRLYEEAAMKSIGETRKDMTWARHPAVQCYYLAEKWKNDPEFKAKKINQIYKWRKNNPGRHQEICREWQSNNKEYKLDYDKKWRSENPEKWKESMRKVRKKMMENPVFRIKQGLRKRLRDKLKGGESSETNAVTGCTTIELRQWLEYQFKGSMSWDNYGTAWHVDHIRPCASFDVSIKADRLAMNHYTNLQPMWAKTNIKKSDSWDGQYEFTHELL
jgi:hypothetical protein